MAKQKKKKKEVKEDSFDYKKYIKEEIKDPDFLYYILSNKITFKEKKDVDELYKKFLDGGIR